MTMFRRRYITDPRYQMGFAKALLRGFAFATVIPASVFLAIAMASTRTADPIHSAEMMAATPGAVGWFFAMALFLAGATFLIGIYISHKYIGPLRRVEAWSARYLLGEPAGKLVLRPGDELGGVVSGLASLVRAKGT